MKVHVRGVETEVDSRPGLFSAKGLDEGSRLLIERVDLTGAALIADLGCGAGAVGLACARLVPQARVHLLDANLRAIRAATEGIRLNGLTNAEAHLSDLFSEVDDARYSHILANPAAQLGNAYLRELTDASMEHLRPDGQLWLVVMRNLKSVFQRFVPGIESVAHGAHHVILRAVKPDPSQ